MAYSTRPVVTIIVPIHNGEPWIDECFRSIQSQTAVEHLSLEISAFNDASTDKTKDILFSWRETLEKDNITLRILHNEASAKGVGFARNQAVQHCQGSYLCFQDIDDIMLPNRILHQYNIAKGHPNSIIGSNFVRSPEGSTSRFTKWANSLTANQLSKQIYTSHGPTLIMPTWFCTREVFNRVGGFSEEGKGTPEDLLFFYSHLDKGGQLVKVDECLLIYRYHLNATSFSIDKRTIWDIRMKRLQEVHLKKWQSFTIWNAGKQGRLFFRSLKPRYQERVEAFCDVDIKKMGKHYEPFDREDRHKAKRRVPIVHFTKAKAPFIICVKLDLTDGVFEKNLLSLNLVEDVDYILFS